MCVSNINLVDKKVNYLYVLEDEPIELGETNLHLSGVCDLCLDSKPQHHLKSIYHVYV